MSDVRIDQAARLAREWASLSPIELVVTEDQPPIPNLPKGIQQCGWTETHYIETPAWQRFVEFSAKDLAGKPMAHRAAYSDGRRHSTFRYRTDDPGVPETITIGPSFDDEVTYGGSARPSPLCYYFLDKTPLHEALPGSIYLGIEQASGKPHHVFLFKNLMWGQVRQDLVLHLAEDGILPAKLIFYKAGADRLVDKPFWSWTATTVETIQGRNIPIKSRMVDYQTDVVGGGGQESTREITIQKVEFGKSYPPTAFWREIDDRAIVFDNVAGKVIEPKVRPTTLTAVVNDPIRVEPVTDNSNLLMMSGLMIGVAALISGMVLWFRRAA